MEFQKFLRVGNLLLLILFPLSWFVPLIEVGLFDKIEISWKIFDQDLPSLFGLKEITIISGIQTLWSEDTYLALLVTFFALFAPLVKTISLSLIQFDLLSKRTQPSVDFIGKLAMADVFIIAILCVVFKGIDIGKIEVLWGTYLFSTCVVCSILISSFNRVK